MAKLHLFENQILQYSHLTKKVIAEAHGKDVHDLRSLSRRLRAELWVLQHASDIKVSPDIIDGLRHLTRKLGVCRQFHVLYKSARTYKLNAKDLKIKRDHSRTDLQKSLAAKWQRQLLGDLEKFKIHLQKKGNLPNARKTKTLLKAQALELKTTERLESAKEWHKLRIGLRKLQYRMEVLDLHSKPLKDLQRLIGQAHDLHVLSEYYPKETKIQKDEGLALKQARKVYRAKIQSAIRSLEKTRIKN